MKTYYRDNRDRFIERDEIVGREGGVPPILIRWRLMPSGEVIGIYNVGMIGEPETGGEMFGSPFRKPPVFQIV